MFEQINDVHSKRLIIAMIISQYWVKSLTETILFQKCFRARAIYSAGVEVDYNMKCSK